MGKSIFVWLGKSNGKNQWKEFGGGDGQSNLDKKRAAGTLKLHYFNNLADRSFRVVIIPRTPFHSVVPLISISDLCCFPQAVFSGQRWVCVCETRDSYA